MRRAARRAGAGGEPGAAEGAHPCSAPSTRVDSLPGLHGAKVVIMGRRGAFLDKAVASLREDGVDASRIAGDVRCVGARAQGPAHDLDSRGMRRAFA